MAPRHRQSAGTSTSQKLTLVLLGCGLAILTLEVGLRIGGEIFLRLQQRENRLSNGKKSSYRVLCLGESTTALGGKDAYPRQLERILNEKAAGATFTVINKGIPAISTDRILEDLEGNLDEYDPDFVVTMMGINDGGEHVPLIRDSDNRFLRTLKSLRTYKLLRLIVLSLGVKVEELRNGAGPDGRQEPDAPRLQEADVERVREARAALEKRIQATPREAQAHLELGRLQLQLGQPQAAEAVLRTAAALEPDDAHAHAALGRACLLQGKIDQAVPSLRRAHRLDPSITEALNDLATIYVYQKKPEEARVLLEKALRSKVANEQSELTLAAAYYHLAADLKSRKRYDEAEGLLRKAMELASENERPYPYGRLALLYREKGDQVLFEKYLRRAQALGYDKRTRSNYLELKRIVNARGIQLVAVQYPLRSIDVLKEMIGTERGVTYVDNEALFMDLLREGSYEDYFVDEFAGDFGHMTPAGNGILAKNIARAILSELASQ